MNPIALLKILFAGIPAADHLVSVNDVRKGPVSLANAQLNGSNIELHYEFAADGNNVVVKGEMPLAAAGKKGGNDTITIDGADVDHDDIVVSNRLVFSGLVIVIEFHYTDAAGNPQKIRIDAKKKFF